MEALSIAASIVGILAAAGKIAETLEPFVSSVKDTTNIAAKVQAEVNSSVIILSALQALLNNLSQTTAERQSLIQVDSLLITLTEGVLVFDELEHLVAQLGNGKRWSNRIQWARKRYTLDALASRMQIFKGSMTLMLSILQCDSEWHAKKQQEEHHTMLLKLLQNNEGLFRRLSLLDHHLPDTAGSHATIRNRLSIDSTISRNRTFEFEQDLRRSAVYRKARRDSYDVSFRSSIAASHAWTALTHVSLSEISAISVVALPLPVSFSELLNSYHYFGNNLRDNIDNNNHQTAMPHTKEIQIKRFSELERIEPDLSRFLDGPLTKMDVERIKGGWLRDNEIACWQLYVERRELSAYPKASVLLLRPILSQLLYLEPSPLISLKLDSLFGDLSKYTHVFIPIRTEQGVGPGSETHWSLLLVSCIDDRSYHYNPDISNRDHLAQSASRSLGLLLGRELQYKQLDEGPQQENTSDSGVYVCLLMRHLLVERLLTGGWDVKIDMDLRDQVLDVKAGRKQMLDIIQTYRSNGEMRRLDSTPLFRELPSF